MRVKRIVTKTNVTSCTNCPWITASMDGPYCPKLIEAGMSTFGAVYPEGRHSIHSQCPLRK